MTITTTTGINYIWCCTAMPTHLWSYFLNIYCIPEALAMTALSSSSAQLLRMCSTHPAHFFCHQERDTCSISSCKTHPPSTGETSKQSAFSWNRSEQSEFFCFSNKYDTLPLPIILPDFALSVTKTFVTPPELNQDYIQRSSGCFSLQTFYMTNLYPLFFFFENTSVLNHSRKEPHKTPKDRKRHRISISTTTPAPSELKENLLT